MFGVEAFYTLGITAISFVRRTMRVGARGFKDLFKPSELSGLQG